MALLEKKQVQKRAIPAILKRIETKFNKKVQKHRRRLLPDNW